MNLRTYFARDRVVPYLFEKMAFENNRFSEQLKHVHV